MKRFLLLLVIALCASSPARGMEATEYIAYFQPGSAELTTQGLNIIQLTIASWKAADPSHYKDDTQTAPWFIIVGHSDPEEPNSGGVELSRRRAIAMADALDAAGAPPDHIAVDWKGDTEPNSWPLVSRGWPTGQSRADANRRVTIDIAFQTPIY